MTDTNKTTASPVVPPVSTTSATDETLKLFMVGEDEASGVKSELKEAESTLSIAQKQEAAVRNAEEFKWCLLQRTQAATGQYEELMNGVTTIAVQDAVEIDLNTKQHNDQAGKVKSAFDALIQSLRTTKTTLSDIEATGAQLSNLLEDSDTTAADEELKWLNRHVRLFPERIREFGGDTGDKNAKNPRAATQGLADVVHDLADDAFEMTVKVIGLNQAANVSSLTPLSKIVADNMKTLDKNVSESADFFQNERKAAQKTLTETLTALRTKRIETYRKGKAVIGLDATLKQVDKPDTSLDDGLVEKTRQRLRHIQKEVESSFATH